MHSAAVRCLNYAPPRTENEEVIVLQAQRIEELIEARQREFAYIESVLKVCSKATAADIREELRDLRAWAANRSTYFTSGSNHGK